jgi:hypothetical protein
MYSLIRPLAVLCFCTTANATLITESADFSNNPFTPTVLPGLHGIGSHIISGSVDPFANDPFDSFLFNILEGLEISHISFTVSNIRVLETYTDNGIETYSFGFSSANFEQLTNATSQSELNDSTHGLSVFFPASYFDGAVITRSLPDDFPWWEIDISRDNLFIVNGGNGFGDFSAREWSLFPGDEQGLSAFDWTYNIEVRESTTVPEPGVLSLLLLGLTFITMRRSRAIQ